MKPEAKKMECMRCNHQWEQESKVVMQYDGKRQLGYTWGYGECPACYSIYFLEAA